MVMFLMVVIMVVLVVIVMIQFSILKVLHPHSSPCCSSQPNAMAAQCLNQGEHPLWKTLQGICIIIIIIIMIMIIINIFFVISKLNAQHLNYYDFIYYM